MARTIDKARVERARALQAAGLSYTEVAADIGVSAFTVVRWLVPERAERHRESVRQSMRRGGLNELEAACRQALAMSKALAEKQGYVACTATVAEAVESHTGRCNICGKEEAQLPRRLSLDHCHKTGRFRGWLCFSCNTGLGKFRDDPQLLEIAIEYLRD